MAVGTGNAVAVGGIEVAVGGIAGVVGSGAAGAESLPHAIAASFNRSNTDSTIARKLNMRVPTVFFLACAPILRAK